MFTVVEPEVRKWGTHNINDVNKRYILGFPLISFYFSRLCTYISYLHLHLQTIKAVCIAPYIWKNTVLTLIRLLQEQSDQSQHCLPFMKYPYEANGLVQICISQELIREVLGGPVHRMITVSLPYLQGQGRVNIGFF